MTVEHQFHTSNAALVSMSAADSIHGVKERRLVDSGGERLAWLQCGRAIAALTVAIFHASGRVTAVADPSSPDLAYAFRFGNAGVDLFFVISGFIIMHAHREDIGRPDRLARYAWRRTTRIYPLYWILCLLVIPLYFVVPSAGAGWQREWTSIFGAVTLLPMPPRTIIGVAWSLVLEMIFYAMFALLLINRTIGGAIFGVWIVAAALTLILGAPSNFFLRHLFSDNFFGFLLGVLIALGYRRLPVGSAVPLVTVGGLAFLGSGAALVVTGADEVNRSLLLELGFDLGSAGMIAGLVVADSARRWRAPALLVHIGNASYSLYLFHWLVGWIFEKGMGKFELRGLFSSLWLLPLLLAVMVAISYVIYLAVERPLLDICRNLWSRRSAARAQGLA